MRFTLNRTFSKEGFEFCGGQNHDDRDQHRDPFSLNRLKGSQSMYKRVLFGNQEFYICYCEMLQDHLWVACMNP